MPQVIPNFSNQNMKKTLPEMNRYLGCPTAHWKAMSIACGEHLTVVFFLQALHLKYLMFVKKKKTENIFWVQPESCCNLAMSNLRSIVRLLW